MSAKKYENIYCKKCKEKITDGYFKQIKHRLMGSRILLRPDILMCGNCWEKLNGEDK